jgi:phosphoglycolate phosphatase
VQPVPADSSNQFPDQLPVSGPVVGFDLDLTLVDSAAGIARTMRAALSAERAGDWPPGEPTEDVLRRTIGIPLEASIGLLAPDADVDRVAAAYRRLYPDLGVPATVLLPGVIQAFAAVRAARGRVLVVSAKTLAAVHAVLAHVGLDPDLVAGDLFAAQKGELLLGEGAHAYVGDHPADMEAARVARATAVGVLTGSADERALRVAGADVVLPDLTAFPSWLDAWWPDVSRPAAGPSLDDEARERHREPDRAEQSHRSHRTGRGPLASPEGQGQAQGQQPDEEDHGTRGDEAAGAAVVR